jgi:hypothetical protein
MYGGRRFLRNGVYDGKVVNMVEASEGTKEASSLGYRILILWPLWVILLKTWPKWVLKHAVHLWFGSEQVESFIFWMWKIGMLTLLYQRLACYWHISLSEAQQFYVTVTYKACVWGILDLSLSWVFAIFRCLLVFLSLSSQVHDCLLPDT